MAKVWDPFWISAFQTKFVPQLNAIVNVLEKRMLPNLEKEKIGEEADRIAEEDWKQFISSISVTGDEDPAYFADRAQNAGIAHYTMMYSIRQGMLNLFAAALYHAFEQQAMFFHRKNVLDLDEENDPRKFKLPLFQSRIKEYGIDIKNFVSWSKIDELRLVANTVKHAEGNSSHKLREIRPDLLSHPRLSQDPFLSQGFYSAFQPLVGDDLSVSLQDVKDYRDHLVRFWQELADVMQCD